MDIKSEIMQIIANYKELDPATVTPESTFEELGIDSLDAIDIIYEIEEKFGVTIPQDGLDLNTAKSVSDILAVVDRVTSAAEADAAADDGESSPPSAPTSSEA